MKAILLAAGQGTRFRPLTDDKPRRMVEVAGKPILSHCFDWFGELGADEFVVVVGYKKEVTVDHYGDTYGQIPVACVHQRDIESLVYALLTIKNHVDDDFMLILGDNISHANLEDVTKRQREDRVNAAFLAEEVP